MLEVTFQVGWDLPLIPLGIPRATLAGSLSTWMASVLATQMMQKQNRTFARI
jgi:hypothetical protein